jgi:hypothetical protein|tara:strand:- start:908 stop:1378 length:471 start_codon:yes stop_codon:yes gene_type:complete
MPERVTKEERIVSLAIEKARRAKELLQQESVHERLPLDDEIEVEKIKRPKVTNVKPKNQTQKKEGYGLAGETTEHKIKKAESNLPDEVTKALDKVAEEIRKAFDDVDLKSLLPLVAPQGRARQRYFDKEEMIETLVKKAIDALKKQKRTSRFDGKL